MRSKACLDWMEVGENPLHIAGVDEVGRGALFGPVVCAAVMMPLHRFIIGIRDSKQLTAKGREEMFELIVRQAAGIGLGLSTHAEIDKMNIYQATKLAMQRAVQQLCNISRPDILYVDAMHLDGTVPCVSIVRGDQKSYNIACASIVAKVSRDRLCYGWGKIFQDYGIEKHKGYGTAFHRQMIQSIGPTTMHRQTFLRKLNEAGE